MVTSNDTTHVDQYISGFVFPSPWIDRRAGTMRDPTVMMIRDVLNKILTIIHKIESLSLRAQEENGGMMSDKDKELLFASLEDLGISNAW